jgi:3-deoxy-D-manno-octulosonic-acid transferase
MNRVVRGIYNILFAVFFVLSSPYYFLRMWRRGSRQTGFPWKKGFSQRFGKYDSKLKQAITNRHRLWMHAVSVGEVNVSTQLIQAMETRLPNLKIIISTTTTTAMEGLQSKLPSHVSKIYYPIDRRAWVSRALGTIRPEAIVLVEAEIWPNFLWRAEQLRIPIFLVNARLSDSSYRGYKRFGFLFRPIFASFAAVGAQNEDDAAKLHQLGCRSEAIHIVGSLKFDAAKLDGKRGLDVPAMLRQLGLAADAQIIVAGSTHAGEESILAEQFIQLRKKFPKLFLVIVPRHMERSRSVGKDLSAHGLKFVYRSDVNGEAQYGPGEVECLVVNTTGELRYFYESATIVFVGKSLTEKGGQNPIEPAALGKPTVFGPNMQNFRDVVRCLLAKDGAVQVRDQRELENVVEKLLADPHRREQLGHNGMQVVRENLGAVERTVDMIVKHLEGSELYVAPKAGSL